MKLRRETYDREVHLCVCAVEVRLFESRSKALLRDPSERDVMDEAYAGNLGGECRIVRFSFFGRVEEQGRVLCVGVGGRVCRRGERRDRVKEGSFVDGDGGVEDPEDVVFCLVDGVVDVVDLRVDADRFRR